MVNNIFCFFDAKAFIVSMLIQGSKEGINKLIG